MRALVKLRIKESWVLLKFLVCRVISLILPKTQIWLISERGHEARDNAFVFYSYLRSNHPEITAKYVIDKTSKDLFRLQNDTNVVLCGSFNHYLYLCRAPYLISTHIMGYTPWMDFFSTLDRRYNIFPKQKKIFLQHGIIKDDLHALKGGNVHLDLFCCGAKGEYEYIRNTFRHPEGVVQYTGLCRFDNLVNYKLKRQILVMPTWRMYIRNQRFDETEYFKRWSEFLTSKELEDLLTSNEYQLVFYPHYEVQKNIDSFMRFSLSKNVTIAGFDYDVQTLLKESMLLITDYSSIYFDFAYMRKPIIMYQFDESEFIENHYQKGYFNEESIGVKVFDIRSLMEEIRTQITIGMKQSDKHQAFVESFFEKADIHNCDRTFDSILKL